MPTAILYNPGSRSVSVAIYSHRDHPGGDSSPSYTLPSKPTPEVEPEDDTRSKNYDLKSLSVDQGTLTPKFSADVTFIQGLASIGCQKHQGNGTGRR